MKPIIKIMMAVWLFLISLSCIVYAKHTQNEHYYQNIWCKEQKGITEYILPDKTRVDCLTKEYAVEFDFAHKWAESVGQSLYYAKMTNKKPAIVLIMEASSDDKYYQRAQLLAQSYNITLFKIKSKDYINYNNEKDLISDLISCIKNWIKLILINIIDML